MQEEFPISLIQNFLFLQKEVNELPVFSAIEVAIMRWLTAEWRNKEMAQALQTSIGTIKRTKERLCGKTRSRNYVGIALFAIRNGYAKI